MRLILTTKKTEERDEAREQEYRAAEEKLRVEDSRRSDVEDERGIWSNVLQSRIDNGASVLAATQDADEALEFYRARFQ